MIKFQNMISLLPLDPGIEIELRFDELDFDLVRALKVDPDIDQTMTPKHGSSIKISLGKLWIDAS